MNYILITLLTLLTVACEPNNDENHENLEFVLISKGILAGGGAEGIEKQNLVITDKGSWDNLMGQMNAVNKINEFSETDIDFSKFMVIAVFESIKSSGGFGLDLEITGDTDAITVSITELTPKPGDFVTTMLTQPYYIVKIPVTDLPIVFE